MKQDNIPGYPGYYLDRKGNLWRFKEDKWVKVKSILVQKDIPMFIFMILILKSHVLED